MTLVPRKSFSFVICVIDYLLMNVVSAAEYHLLYHNGKPSTDPFQSHTTKFKQQCISICATFCKCHSFTVEIISPNELECNFYDTAAMREDLVPANGVQYNIELRECRDWYNVGARRTGVYTVMWMGRIKKDVRCNMDLDGGGWTVFQRRFKPLSQNFDLDWQSYKRGFGDKNKDFWLGNDFIHEITSSKPHYILMFGRKPNGETVLSKYGSFYIKSETESYEIQLDATQLGHVSSLGESKGMKFTTGDRDNDLWSQDCGRFGGWWYTNCGNVRPNQGDRIRWHSVNGEDGLEEVEIMFKSM